MYAHIHMRIQANSLRLWSENGPIDWANEKWPHDMMHNDGVEEQRVQAREKELLRAKARLTLTGLASVSDRGVSMCVCVCVCHACVHMLLLWGGYD